MAKLTKIASGVAALAGATAPQEGEASFAGMLARNADTMMADIAQKMKNAGLPRDEIWQKTGWFEGPDQKWRFEIDDSAASYVPSGLEMSDQGYLTGHLPQAYTNSEVLDAYPDLRYTDLTQYPFKNENTVGQFRPGSKEFDFGDSVTLWRDGGNLSTLSHEVQHNIQEIEGFAKGGSPSMFTGAKVENPAYSRVRPILDQIDAIRVQPEYSRQQMQSNDLFKAEYEPRIDAIDAVIDADPNGDGVEGLFSQIDSIFDEYRSAQQERFPLLAEADELAKGLKNFNTKPTLNPDAAYRSLAGEVEARNVQKRLNMDPAERRATPPWVTQDTPDEQQIVRGVDEVKANQEYAAAVTKQLETAIGAYKFMDRRAAKGDKWKQKRAEILNTINQYAGGALDALDMPMRGYQGIAATAGSLAAGNSLQDALMRGGTVARQPLEQTAYDLGGAVTDKTGSPALGTAAYLASTLGGPI